MEKYLLLRELPCSCPAQFERALPFGELEPGTSTFLPVLFPFLHSGVAGEESCATQDGSDFFVSFNERARDTEPEGAGLSRHTASADTRSHVELAQRLQLFQRLPDQHDERFSAEIRLKRVAVNGHHTRSGTQTDSRNRCFPSSCGAIFYGLFHLI